MQGCTRDLEGGGDGGGRRQNPSAEGGELKRFFNYDAGLLLAGSGELI